jgi:hypothetical protein
MLRIRAYTFILAVLLACSDGTGPGTEGPLLMSAELDNTAWSLEDGGRTFAYLTPDRYLFVGAIRNDSLGHSRDGIGVQVVGFAGPGHYALTPEPAGDTGLYALYNPSTGGAVNFFSDSASPGELIVSELDTIARRIAGRFSFQAREDNGDQVVLVEEGVFRVEYTTVRP